MSIPAAAMRRLMREVAELQKSPPEGIRIQTSEENLLDIVGIIEGPEGTPYAGGYFKVKFKFTEEFPAAPPKCWFATKLFHPNVSSSGEICVNTLKKDWKSSYGIAHILVTVKCLLIYPNPESALDEEAGKLLLEDYQSYCNRAKLITSVHATPKMKPVEFQTPAVTGSTDSAPVASSSKPPSTATSKPISTGTTNNAVSETPAVLTPRKTSSSAPVSFKDKEGVSTTIKERHVSPSPLGTADANVGKPVVVATVPTPATKAVKRAATSNPSSGAEKRKKALKRL